MPSTTLLKPSQALAADFSSQSAAQFFFQVKKDEKKHHIFHAITLGTLHLLIPGHILGEVVDELNICRLPKSSAFLVGMSNLRGHIIPVFDLYKILGLDMPDVTCHRVMVIGSDSDKVGFLIAQLPSKVNLYDDDKLQKLPPLPEILIPYIKECYSKEGIWLTWDIFRFFEEVGNNV